MVNLLNVTENTAISVWGFQAVIKQINTEFLKLSNLTDSFITAI